MEDTMDRSTRAGGIGMNSTPTTTMVRQRGTNLIFYVFMGVLVIGSLLQLRVYHLAFTCDTETSVGAAGKGLGIWSKKSSRSGSGGGDPSTLLDIKNFTWISNNEGICGNSSESERAASSYPRRIFPILVLTARDHSMERSEIRKTWGSLRSYRGWEVRVIFLLGQADKAAIGGGAVDGGNQLLLLEQGRFGDLVIGNFTDSYRNLTYKTMMGFKWILEFCREAKFMLKTDDDMFIDTFRWLDWLSDDLDTYAMDRNYILPDLICNYWRNAPPDRSKSSKVYVPLEEWSNSSFPNYCSGWGYAMKTDLLEKIYSVANSVRRFYLEDVFTTGILLNKVRETFHLEPKIRSVWKEVNYWKDNWRNRNSCKRGSLNYTRLFGAVAQVGRGTSAKRELNCWWDKVNYDRSILLENNATV